MKYMKLKITLSLIKTLSKLQQQHTFIQEVSVPLYNVPYYCVLGD